MRNENKNACEAHFCDAIVNLVKHNNSKDSHEKVINDVQHILMAISAIRTGTGGPRLMTRIQDIDERC